jgi:hypothetical protein
MDLMDTGPSGQPVGDAIAIMPAGLRGHDSQNIGCNAAALPQYVAEIFDDLARIGLVDRRACLEFVSICRDAHNENEKTPAARGGRGFSNRESPGSINIRRR